MIRREKVIQNEEITKNQKIKDCILIDCTIEEGTLIQNSKIIIDGEVVSPDCDCLKKQDFETEAFNESFEKIEGED